ncbi:MAG: tyrosine-type recombinase/integrase [Candidatus Bathyarchaeia archaeon]
MEITLGPEATEFLGALRTESTRRQYAEALEHFSRYLFNTFGLTISDFLAEAEADLARPSLQKTRFARKALTGFSEYLTLMGKAPKTVNCYVSVIQSLAKYYDIPISLKFVPRPPVRPVNKKHDWTIHEIGRFVELMPDVQSKCIAAIIVQSGLSISDVLALKYGDIREEYEGGKCPLCIAISRQKTNVQFLTFIGEWALSLLRRHLKGRRLSDDDPIFTLARTTVDKYFRKAGRKFGSFKGRNPYSPHSLRAAFSTILRDHQVNDIYVEFWLGHKLPEQQLAYISKSRESWRETYRTLAEPWLTPPNFKTALHV